MIKKLDLFNNTNINKDDIRVIPKEVRATILSVLNENNSDMVAIYGSYGTSRFHEESDIDIAWLPKHKVDLYKCAELSGEISDILGIEVDLKTLGDIYPVSIEKEMLEGTILYSNENYNVFLMNYDRLNEAMLYINHGGDLYYGI